MLAQSKSVIDAARAVGVRHVVHIGAHAAPDTTIVHLGWHQLIEAYLERSGLGWTNLRPTSYMQNLPMLRALAAAPPQILPHYIGHAATSWIDAQDVGRAAARVLIDSPAHQERSYSLGTESATMDRIAEILSELTGSTWRAEARDPEDFRRTMIAAGADPVYMACVTTIFQRTSAGELPDLNQTFDSFSEITGEAPTGLRAFLMRESAAFA
jgi:NAD(P)H dehydrogenase (quinone)